MVLVDFRLGVISRIPLVRNLGHFIHDYDSGSWTNGIISQRDIVYGFLTSVQTMTISVYSPKQSLAATASVLLCLALAFLSDSAQHPPALLSCPRSRQVQPPIENYDLSVNDYLLSIIFLPCLPP